MIENLPALIAQKIPTALWRLPQAKEIHWIADIDRQCRIQKPDIENAPQGFWISPFWNENLAHTYFIPAGWYAQYVDNLWKTTTKDRQLVDLPTENLDFSTISSFFNSNTPIERHTSEAHEDLVRTGIEAIAQGEMRKLVLSRAKSIAYPAHFDIWQTFQRLCLAYPTAFCYFFHLPEVGTWMGATPETLIAIEQQKIFRTIALAGTQAYKGQEVRDALWSQKEIEEQAIVSRYIINCFKKIRLREFEEDGPKTVIAGHLMHLQTNFWVDMQTGEFPRLGSQMLELLHPTSAVCGMPKEISQQFILAHEGYDRQFYSGFLGASQIAGDTHLFVNLRCMQLHPDSLTLYAGGGITIDSVPEKEWQETELKMGIMQKVLMA